MQLNCSVTIVTIVINNYKLKLNLQYSFNTRNLKFKRKKLKLIQILIYQKPYLCYGNLKRNILYYITSHQGLSY